MDLAEILYNKWFDCGIFLSTRAFYDGDFFSGVLVTLDLRVMTYRPHDTTATHLQELGESAARLLHVWEF